MSICAVLSNIPALTSGPHKLPLIGRADWNDCLNLNCFSTEPGEPFQTTGPSEGPVAESVFIAGMFVKYGKEFAEISRHIGDTAAADKAEKAVDAYVSGSSGCRMGRRMVCPCI